MLYPAELQALLQPRVVTVAQDFSLCLDCERGETCGNSATRGSEHFEYQSSDASYPSRRSRMSSESRAVRIRRVTKLLPRSILCPGEARPERRLLPALSEFLPLGMQREAAGSG